MTTTSDQDPDEPFRLPPELVEKLNSQLTDAIKASGSFDRIIQLGEQAAAQAFDKNRVFSGFNARMMPTFERLVQMMEEQQNFSSRIVGMLEVQLPNLEIAMTGTYTPPPSEPTAPDDAREPKADMFAMLGTFGVCHQIVTAALEAEGLTPDPLLIPMLAMFLTMILLGAYEKFR